MADDDAFLAAIAARPADRTARLVYADWLDERDDPRGELIRVEEEMRELPVTGDRYWALKPRRNELRAAADPEWLGRMRYGTEAEPVFRHGIPDDWHGRWRLIREFTERWHRRPMPDVGGREGEVRDAERTLGRSLPPSVREWVAFAYDVRRDEDYHAVFRDGYQMEDVPGHPALSLLLQAEGDYHWAVRHADLGLPDPPVHGYLLDFVRGNEMTFVPADQTPMAGTVTQFVLDYTMSYLYPAGGFQTQVQSPAGLMEQLAAAFPVRATLGGQEIFEAENILVTVGPSIWTPDEVRLRVEVFKQVPREAVPAFLWEYTRGGGSFHGMFTPEDTPGGGAAVRG